MMFFSKEVDVLRTRGPSPRPLKMRIGGKVYVQT